MAKLSRIDTAGGLADINAFSVADGSSSLLVLPNEP